MKHFRVFVEILVIVFCLSCNQKKQVLFELMDNTGIDFTNVVMDGELENGFTFRNFYNGGGVAIGDINNDGLADVFFTSNMGKNKLYLNKGQFRFEDISEGSGMKQDSMWSTGVAFVDINADGWLDIYVCNSGNMANGKRRNKLYINDKNLTFTESASEYGLGISAYTTHVSFFDYDLDGDLDCFMINNSPIPINTLSFSNRRNLPEAEWPIKNFLKGGGDHLYRNDNGKFTEVTRQAGIHGTLISFGLGVSVGDVNNDGYPDVYVSNDSYERDYLYLNQKDGTFRDDFEKCIEHTSFSSMGADIADVNNDGYPDIFTTDMLPEDDYRLKTLGSFDNIDQYKNKERLGFYRQFMMNCLQVNKGNGKFSEVAHYSGVAATDWSWGALLFDADNDGLNDILVCNGVKKDVTDLDFMNFFANDAIHEMVLTARKDNVYEVLKHIPENPQANFVYKNQGNLKFSNETLSWGFDKKSYSNGAAYGDLDNDGDLDVIVNNIDEAAFVYKNNSRELNKNNYIGVQLKGKHNNTFAVGSRINIYAGGQVILRELIPSRGFQSSVDYKTIVGLGSMSKIDSMIITWPDLSVTKYEHPAINKVYNINYEEVKKQSSFPRVRTYSSLFIPVDSMFEKHRENEFIDFHHELNIPLMLSAEGPRAAYADVNNDGLDDVFIGGATGQEGRLYLQTPDGSFVIKPQPSLARFADFEDVAVLLFDCDTDGDMDLFIGAGGNSVGPNSRELQHRLYKNDGKGNFELDSDAFPLNNMNISVCAANDFDADGDQDLFVGGRSVPANYGMDATSYIFLNDGRGHFKDIAADKNPEIARIGMVTDATWADIAGDTNKELIIVGDWMVPRIFSYNGTSFDELKTNLDGLKGWWQSVKTADLDNDGTQDLILGNIGKNFYLHPDKDNSVKLWMGDVDGSGDIDKIITRSVNGEDKPVFLKHEMQEQIPSIKKENLRHSDYAKKSIQQLFPADVLKKCIVKQFNYSGSCIALNKRDGQFLNRELPYQGQLSSLNTVLCIDVNKDGFADLVTGYNRSDFPPQLGRLDAGFSDVFINDGKGNFECLGSKETGLEVTGQVKDIVLLRGKERNLVLFLRNNERPLVYEMNINQ